MEENNWIGNVIIGLIVVALIGAVAWGLQDGGDPTREVNVEITEDDNVLGNEDAKVTLVEYSDFQCPACRAYEPIIEELLDSYSDEELRFVYRHFPLSSIHPNAVAAAQAAEAAGEEGKFWEMKEILFANQAEWSDLEDPKPVFSGSYAKSLDLDLGEFDEDMLEDDDSRARVEQDYQSGLALGIQGTPTFILNGVIINNPQSVEEFKALIDAELAE